MLNVGLQYIPCYVLDIYRSIVEVCWAINVYCASLCILALACTTFPIKLFGNKDG